MDAPLASSAQLAGPSSAAPEMTSTRCNSSALIDRLERVHRANGREVEPQRRGQERSGKYPQSGPQPEPGAQEAADQRAERNGAVRRGAKGSGHPAKQGLWG